MKSFRIYDELNRRLLIEKDKKGWVLFDEKGNIYLKGSLKKIGKFLNNEIKKGNLKLVKI
jgi:hypothetical protein